MYLEIKKVNWLVCELTYGKPTPLIVDVHLARTNAERFFGWLKSLMGPDQI